VDVTEPIASAALSLIEELKQRMESREPAAHPFWIGVPRAYPPIESDRLAEVERHHGFRLPAVLRTIYTNLGNGGWAIGPGIMGIDCRCNPRRAGADELRDDSDDAIAMMQVLGRRALKDGTTKRVMPFCDWGCNQWSCVDLDDPNHPVWFYDGNQSSHDEDVDEDAFWTLEAGSIEDWFRRWLRGETTNPAR
jgi:hypothetical protein